MPNISPEVEAFARIPYFTERQLGRHRTMRRNGFLEGFLAQPSAYVPAHDQLRKQSDANKQGRAEELDAATKERISAVLSGSYSAQAAFISEADRVGVDFRHSDEQTGVGFYTDWTIGSDLKNLFHYLGLRLDSHAQHEARETSLPLAAFAQIVAPVAYKAFMDYNLNGVRLSSGETRAVALMYSGKSFGDATTEAGMANKRELAEFESKLHFFGLNGD